MPFPWHAPAVHFGVGLALAGVGCELAARRWPRRGLEEAARWNLVLGAVGLAIAAATGAYDHEAVEHARSPFAHQIKALLEYHETLGFIAAGLFAAVAAWRFHFAAWRPRLLAYVALIGAALLFVQGYLGGEMVFRYGAAVSAPRARALRLHRPRNGPAPRAERRRLGG